MPLLAIGTLECLILAALILVIAFARRLPPAWAGLAAAILVSAALLVEIYAIGKIATTGETAAAAAASRNVVAIRHILPKVFGDTPVQAKAHA